MQGHNWWIAAFEAAGIWTKDQAEHVSNEIRTVIHKEDYRGAFQELKAVLEKGDFKGLPAVAKLETKIADLEERLSKIENKK